MHLKFKVFALFITHKLLVQISIFMYHNTTKNILQNMKIKMHVIQKSKQLNTFTADDANYYFSIHYNLVRVTIKNLIFGQRYL
jgi:hypothetical protein